ncbi:hypothetical protein [Ornithinimicrobium murale]|uniref:hypothetical protein n=1 Tax=Ornithinimicrobium murale TaxID=1050153 RepID=UPI00192D5046|nr:hypothetical protein [Ornithinimicrobium murale]
MGRSNRKRRGGRVQPRRNGPPVERRPVLDEVEFGGQAWAARQVGGNDSGRAYLCPGCLQELPATTPHTVAWPTAGMHGVENRRHWHTTCWNARDRRRPGEAWA